MFVHLACHSICHACRMFLDHLVNLVGLATVLYAIAQFYSFVSNDSIIKHTVRCYACRKEISSKVSIMLSVNVRVATDAASNRQRDADFARAGRTRGRIVRQVHYNSSQSRISRGFIESLLEVCRCYRCEFMPGMFSFVV